MIITCSQCQTRFKVGDDKLAAGPIRVRCSKCNFVFMATAAGAPPPSSPLAQPPSASLPPTSLSTLPPQPGFVPSSPTPRPVAGPITGMFQAFGAGDVPSPSGFGSPTNRSGIFKAPPSDFRPPPNDPFAGLAPPAPPAPPALPRPPSVPPSMPSLGSMPPMSAMPSFPGAPTSAPPAPSQSIDPFAGIAPPPAPDPFGSPVPSSDPFGSLPTVPSTPHAKDPFGLGTPPPSMPTFAPPSPPPSPFGAAPYNLNLGGDPSAQTESHNTTDLFGAGARMATDPFGASAPVQNAGAGNGSVDGSVSGSFNAAVDDPFGALDASVGSVESMTPTGPPGPPPEESDPFADLDIGGGSSAGAGAVDDPFDRPPPKPAPPPPPQHAAPEPRAPSASSAQSSAAPVPAPADRAKLQRLEAAQRVRAIAWGAVQLVIFIAFLTIAVVVGRGGTLDDLMRGDVAAALGGPRIEGELAIEEPRVKKRTLPSGLDVVIVSGQVRNTTQGSVPGARVEVTLGSQPPASGWAWTSLDGVDLAAVANADALAALAQRVPSSASLAPGERAPFVVVAPAPADGLPAAFSVKAAAPPAAPPTAPPAAPPATP